MLLTRTLRPTTTTTTPFQVCNGKSRYASRCALKAVYSPHGTYNTSITGDILERGDVRPGWRKRKDEAEEHGKGRISSSGAAAKRARSKILGTIVVLPLNFPSFLSPCVSLSRYFFFHHPFRSLFSDAVLPITKRLTILSRELSMSPCSVIQTKTVTAKCRQSGETSLDIALISRNGICAFVTIVLFIYLIGLTTFRVFLMLRTRIL